jgi:hypothetical protein
VPTQACSQPFAKLFLEKARASNGSEKSTQFVVLTARFAQDAKTQSFENVTFLFFSLLLSVRLVIQFTQLPI